MAISSKKVVDGLFWQIVNFAGKAILNIFYLVILTRILSKEDFGVFAILMIFVNFLNIFTQSGVGSALVHRHEISKRHIRTAFAMILLICVFFSLLLVLASPKIISFFDYKISNMMLPVLALNNLFLNISVISYSLLIKTFKFKQIAIASLLSYLVGTFMTTIALAYYGFGIWSILIGLSVKNIIYSVILLIYQPHDFLPKIYKSEFNELYSYGFGLTSIRFIQAFSNQIDKIVLSKLVPIEILGVFERGQSLVKLPYDYLGSTLDSVLFSSFSKVNHNVNLLRTYFLGAINFILIITSLIAVHFIFFSSGLVRILYGSKWLNGTETVVNLLSISLVFFIYARFTDTLVRSTGVMKESIKNKLLFLFLNVVGIYFGYSYYGLAGCLIAIGLAQTSYAISMMFLSMSILKIGVKQFIYEISGFLRYVVLILFISMCILILFNKSPVLGLLVNLLVTVSVSCLILFTYPKIIGQNTIRMILTLMKPRLNYRLVNIVHNRIEKMITSNER